MLSLSLSCFKLGLVNSLSVSLTTHKINLILCEGNIRVLRGRSKIKAGEIMFEFPDCVVCHADSFFLGRPIPILGIHDRLAAGHAYFVIPLDRLPGNGPLSAASLSTLGGSSPCGRRSPPVINGNESPFDYVKDKEGRVVMIKVVPEFIMKVISSNYLMGMGNESSNSSNKKMICNTPELQKQYDQLVRSKDQAWSPKLETISECKVKFTPFRFLGLQKEK